MPVIGTPVDATWVNPSSVQLTGAELRRADSTAFAGAGSALGITGGIVRHGDTSLKVTVNGSDVVTVQPGAAVIAGNATAVGCYRTALPAAVSGALTARDATNGRIDLVVLHQLDTDVVPTSAGYQAQVETITGTPSATPGVPVMPSQAIELARVTVPATGGGAAVVDLSFVTFAAALGSEISVPTKTRLPATAAKYQRARALDTGKRFEWSGSAWVAQTLVQSDNSVTVPVTTANTVFTQAVTFPTAFDAAPAVQVNPPTGATLGNFDLIATDVTATGFNIRYRKTSTGSFTVSWIAVGT